MLGEQEEMVALAMRESLARPATTGGGASGDAARGGAAAAATSDREAVKAEAERQEEVPNSPLSRLSTPSSSLLVFSPPPPLYLVLNRFLLLTYETPGSALAPPLSSPPSSC